MRDVKFTSEQLRMFAKAVLSLPVLAAASVATLIFIAFVQTQKPPPTLPPVPAAPVDSKFLYSFSTDGILEEAFPVSESKSPYWWLNSGGELIIAGGVGETIQGELMKSNPWYEEYKDTNPIDTDGGVHPQNLLRLVSRSSWENVRLEASYFIAKDDLSDSPNRNESNGLLLMSRYGADGQTLYYAGIRVDGTAVIKKKYNGTYYTMDQKQVFPGTYDRDKSPDLLPHGEWIRLRSDTVTEKDGSVTIQLSQQDPETKKWELILSANDNSQYDNTPSITGEAPIGLRTDFMDVKFDDILMQAL